MATASDTKWIVDYSAWEDRDYIVTIRPHWEKPWHEAVIGGTLNKDVAKRVAEWLQDAIDELWKIFKNMENEQ